MNLQKFWTVQVDLKKVPLWSFMSKNIFSFVRKNKTKYFQAHCKIKIFKAGWTDLKLFGD